MRSVLSLLLIVLLIGVSVLGAVLWPHVALALGDDCPLASISRDDCPTNLVALVLHHVSALQFMDQVTIIVLTIILAVWLVFGSKWSPPPLGFGRLSRRRLPAASRARQKLMAWLAFLEHSPSL
jgi:hypothetical protein